MLRRVKNHVILKVYFKHEIHGGSPDAPERTVGIRVSMETDANVPLPSTNQSLFGGNLKLKTFTYRGPTRSALKVVNIPILARDITLFQFLAPVKEHHMHRFLFVSSGRDFMGCRDFITQLVRRLDLAGIIDPSSEVESVYQVLAFRYLDPDYVDEHELRELNRIDRGMFVQSYVRVDIPGHSHLCP
ncbi:hypothetical protein Plec18167_001950 [Paecilomyces lecythidis]|uniref:DUF7770 domain-containing protein n=1 Tax=Paecilomyces lecythidis TaxID=3004212 RepID=A0ABR3YAF5_9EURO